MNNEEATFQTFSQFIQSSSELNNLVESHLREISLKNDKYALIGLHSCGNLSNSIVNLYVNSHQQIEFVSGCKLLCNVACCYNQLDEKYIKNTYDDKVSCVDDASKFPMSSVLNNVKYFLGPGLTRVGCHSFEKNLKFYDDITEVIHYKLTFVLFDLVYSVYSLFSKIHNTSGLHTLWIRCLVWKIVLDKFPSLRDHLLAFFRNKGDRNDLKIYKKNSDEKQDELASFVHYARGCLEKIKILNDQVTMNN